MKEIKEMSLNVDFGDDEYIKGAFPLCTREDYYLGFAYRSRIAASTKIQNVISEFFFIAKNIICKV